MSKEYEGQDPLVLAQQAERDLNSQGAKKGLSSSDSGKSFSDIDRNAHDLIITATESGIDEAAVNKYPGAEVKIGSAASGAGDNREIPVEEGGDISNRGT